LHGKVAIVTGGNGGIGLGMARGLAQAGASIVVAARNAEKTDAALGQLRACGAPAIGLKVDVNSSQQVTQMVAGAVDAFGGVDILVANAGMSIRKRPEAYSLEEWGAVVATDLTSVFACCQAVYAPMQQRGGGKILTIGSMASLFGLNMAAPYAAAKGGVVQLTKSLASAWARDNITVNCVLPGWFDTDLTQGARRALPRLDESVVDRTPFKRWGRPDDLAGAAVFFCSRASDFITGATLAVDGGFSSSMF